MNETTVWHAPWCDHQQHQLAQEGDPDVPVGCVGPVIGNDDIAGWWVEQGFALDLEPALRDGLMSHEHVRNLIRVLEQALQQRPS